MLIQQNCLIQQSSVCLYAFPDLYISQDMLSLKDISNFAKDFGISSRVASHQVWPWECTHPTHGSRYRWHSHGIGPGLISPPSLK